ncbi:MAG: Ubiquinol-cytochrome C reductase iron-sulfur subunit [uncultured Sulfurovum sp.]|uniref:Ubiquinol-cytochrome C reductase iron-sulfur subunit n=1 Tax=uncultured Sulfurovum sp. TaxID=269237 RepID=A0A6S6U8Z7_9BACT|nr:MAG: Ubiquinol-cytochrome C reductase iron-sulfur subunit [uncultured Sulfurovum sp.]
MERRSFLKITGASAAAVAVSPSLIAETLKADNGALFKAYEKVQLKDKDGNPLKAASLVKEEAYVFNYPHAATPALLVDLATATKKDVKLKADDGTEYVYAGGHGANGTIVAYSAICPHSLTHPQKSMSMFNYVDEKGKTMSYTQGGVMVCTSHLSAFEPKEGGKVVGGPATQGIPAIVLEIDKDDHIWAVAVLGPDKFQDFFSAFKQDHKKEYGRRGAKKLVKTEAMVQELKNFTAEQIIA